MIISADTSGQVNFTSVETRELIKTIGLPGNSLTSLHVSPDGSFMAIGDSQATMSLWDLRLLDIPDLLMRPCGTSFAGDLAAASEFLADTGLPEDVRSAVEFLRCVLRYRCRHDIELDEAITIQAGEFDIEIEG